MKILHIKTKFSRWKLSKF